MDNTRRTLISFTNLPLQSLTLTVTLDIIRLTLLSAPGYIGAEGVEAPAYSVAGESQGVFAQGKLHKDRIYVNVDLLGKVS